MHKLPLAITLLTCCGYWRPSKWPIRSFKYWLYNSYSLIMVAFLYSFAFCACVDSLIGKNLNAIADKLSVGLSVLRVCIQIPILLIQREKIIFVMNIPRQEDCIPKDEQEMIIQRKCDNFARKVTIYCELLNESAAAATSVVQLKKLIRTRTLPKFDWLPYSVDSLELYLISLLHQTLGLMVCASTSVAIETLVASLLMQAKAQFEILCHRVRNVPTTLMETERNNPSRENFRNNWREVCRNLVKYHRQIINFVHSINATFQHIILIQLLVSSTVLCLSIYQMSNLDLLSIDTVFSYSYLGSMLLQVYLYCWFANEMTLKSNEVADAIYQMDWTILPTDMLKDLLFIITRSMKPVKISCGHILILSVDTFMSIVKLSYSSYNLLKSSEET